MMRSGGLPRQRITSGNPRRRSRCESSLANPRSSYGRSRRASIACPTVSFPAFRSRSSDSTRCRSTASPDLFPLLELQDGAQGAAAFNLFPDPVLALQDVDGAVRHLDRLFLRHDDESGFVPDDPVARVDLLATQSISLPISPRPFGSPACGATWRLKQGKLSSRIVSRSRTAPSITTPATPFTRHEWLASSPQTAVGPPPTSITITSPGFARSIAST